MVGEAGSRDSARQSASNWGRSSAGVLGVVLCVRQFGIKEGEKRWGRGESGGDDTDTDTMALDCMMAESKGALTPLGRRDAWWSS